MGTLPPHVQDRVAAHIERCVVCQALGDALDDPSVAELRPDEQDRILERIHAGAHASTRTRRLNRLWQFGAAAAAVSLLIAGTVLVRQSRRQAPPAPAAPQVAAKAPRPPAPSVFQLQKPSFRQPAASDLLWRGSGSREGSDDLTRAFDALRKNDFEEAARLLQVLVARQPRSATAEFYLGVTDLFLEHEHEAVTALQVAERLANDDADLGREATWYPGGRLLSNRADRTGQAQAGGALPGTEPAGRPGVRRNPRAVRAHYALRNRHRTWGRPARRRAGRRTARPDRTRCDRGVSDGSHHDDGCSRPLQHCGCSHPGLAGLQGRLLHDRQGDHDHHADTQVDFSMDPWEFISLGETVRRTIKPGDTTCGDPNELCHRFALSVPADGTLDVVLDSPSPGTFSPQPYRADALRNWDLHLETPQGDAYGPPLGTSFPMRLSIPVQRGATYQIRVLSYADRAREFELRTQLR